MTRKQHSVYLYVCYIDMVDSSRGDMNIYDQISKLESLNENVQEAIVPSMVYQDSDILHPDYFTYLGDGAMICFRNGIDVLNFVVNLFLFLLENNRNKVDNLQQIHIRVGISSGETLPVILNNRNKKAPWGRDMVIAKRIMDIAVPDQILISEHTVNQLIQFLPANSKFAFRDKQMHKVKHGQTVHVFSLTYKAGLRIIGNDSDPSCDCHPRIN